MVPFSYRQAEADCTSAIDLDPKVRSCFFVFSAFALYYRAMCNGCYSNIFNTCEIRMEPTILQFVLELYGCAVGKHPNDFFTVFVVSRPRSNFKTVYTFDFG